MKFTNIQYYYFLIKLTLLSFAHLDSAHFSVRCKTCPILGFIKDKLLMKYPFQLPRNLFVNRKFVTLCFAAQKETHKYISLFLKNTVK